MCCIFWSLIGLISFISLFIGEAGVHVYDWYSSHLVPENAKKPYWKIFMIVFSLFNVLSPDPLNFLFSFPAPTAGPANVQVSNVSSTSLVVTWDPPPRYQIHGIIRHYSIRYRKINLNSDDANLTAWKFVSVDSSMRSTILSHLVKWAFYSVQVNAVTIKNGKWSAEIQHRTSEDGKMTDFVFYAAFAIFYCTIKGLTIE